MQKKLTVFSILMVLFALSGCNKKTKSFLGFDKTTPDEFTVIPNQSLTVPPIFILPDPDAFANSKNTTQDNDAPLSHEDKKFMNQVNQVNQSIEKVRGENQMLNMKQMNKSRKKELDENQILNQYDDKNLK
jgi:hypothetical protein